MNTHTHTQKKRRFEGGFMQIDCIFVESKNNLKINNDIKLESLHFFMNCRDINDFFQRCGDLMIEWMNAFSILQRETFIESIKVKINVLNYQLFFYLRSIKTNPIEQINIWYCLDIKIELTTIHYYENCKWVWRRYNFEFIK